MPEAQTIGEVIAALDQIIIQARGEQSRLGYFAALYRRVTCAVRDGIAGGRFEDGARMERFDVVFANRYLAAYDQFRAGADPGRAWTVAFDAAPDPLPLVVQQLLAGMNAHINFDLGIAAAAVGALKTDFDAVNAILAEQTDAVLTELAMVSPAIGLLGDLGLKAGAQIINFNMVTARDLAWATAGRLAVTPREMWSASNDALDLTVAALGLAVLHPPPRIAAKLAPIRAVEWNDVVKVLDVLAG